MDFKKKKRLIFLLSYVLFACGLVWWFEFQYIFTIIIVLVPPAVVNFWWLKRSRLKIFLFSIFATFLFAPPVELSARLADVWEVQTIFPEILGFIPIENMLFAFLNFFWVLSFYEYFVDRDTSPKISPRFKYLIGFLCLISIVVYSLYAYDKQLIALNYFELAFFILIIPAVTIFTKKPSLLKKSILTTLFFAVVFFTYELVALKIGNWWWPGEYWLTFTVWGEVFPFDDIIIWYFLSTPVLIGGYEFFIDDWK
ncbi:MAG: hypothetical protein ACLFNN_00555 [Candidatus Paceibacterota bacterium]